MKHTQSKVELGCLVLALITSVVIVFFVRSTLYENAKQLNYPSIYETSTLTIELDEYDSVNKSRYIHLSSKTPAVVTIKYYGTRIATKLNPNETQTILLESFRREGVLNQGIGFSISIRQGTHIVNTEISFPSNFEIVRD